MGKVDWLRQKRKSSEKKGGGSGQSASGNYSDWVVTRIYGFYFPCSWSLPKQSRRQPYQQPVLSGWTKPFATCFYLYSLKTAMNSRRTASLLGVQFRADLDMPSPLSAHTNGDDHSHLNRIALADNWIGQRTSNSRLRERRTGARMDGGDPLSLPATSFTPSFDGFCARSICFSPLKII